MPERGPLQAIPETVYALARLSEYEDHDLATSFQHVLRRVRAVAPDCVGVTVSYLRDGLAFTWLASGIDVACLDAVQYLDSGPCIEVLDSGRVTAWAPGGALDEGRWALYARASAVSGVASTLSLPVVRGKTVTASVNLYGATTAAFDRRNEALAALFGAWAGGAVTNADLSLSGVQRARATPEQLDQDAVVSQAIGMLMAAHGLDQDAAARRLSAAALRAGIEEVTLARVIVEERLLDP